MPSLKIVPALLLDVFAIATTVHVGCSNSTDDDASSEQEVYGYGYRYGYKK